MNALKTLDEVCQIAFQNLMPIRTVASNVRIYFTPPQPALGIIILKGICQPDIWKRAHRCGSVWVSLTIPGAALLSYLLVIGEVSLLILLKTKVMGIIPVSPVPFVVGQGSLEWLLLAFCQLSRETLCLCSDYDNHPLCTLSILPWLTPRLEGCLTTFL